jgi:hypothetical protein
VRRRRSLRHEGQLQVVDNPVHPGLVGDKGDELQIIHPLHPFRLFSIPVANLTFSFIKGEAFQGKEESKNWGHPTYFQIFPFLQGRKLIEL